MERFCIYTGRRKNATLTDQFQGPTPRFLPVSSDLPRETARARFVLHAIGSRGEGGVGRATAGRDNRGSFPVSEFWLDCGIPRLTYNGVWPTARAPADIRAHRTKREKGNGGETPREKGKGGERERGMWGAAGERDNRRERGGMPGQGDGGEAQGEEEESAALGGRRNI